MSAANILIIEDDADIREGVRILLEGEDYQDQGFVFAQDTGGPMHPDSVTTWLSRFSKRHGLPHVNAHAFRHTMASIGSGSTI